MNCLFYVLQNKLLDNVAIIEPKVPAWEKELMMPSWRWQISPSCHKALSHCSLF